jgi:hypothetical protein
MMPLSPEKNAIPFKFKDVTGKLISHGHYWASNKFCRASAELKEAGRFR